MGIVNRSKDVSEQYENIDMMQSGTVTGKNYLVGRAKRPCQIQTARATAVGMSGAPTATLKLQRFVVGAGLTTISISGALTHTAIGTSGVQTFSMPAAGSSLLDLQAGDFVVATTAGTDAALEQLLVEVIVKNIQDIKSWG